MKRVGVTLVEVLIVTLIVAILVAIVTPILLGAKKRSRDAVVASQLHQLWIATELYVQAESLTSPPLSSEALRLDPKNRDIVRIRNTPWLPRQVDTAPRPNCPFLGDFVYMRYIQALKNDEGWEFWSEKFGSTLPLFVSLHPSYDELPGGLPGNREVIPIGCTAYEPKMISKSYQCYIDGSVKLRRHPVSTGPTYTYFSYANLMFY